MLPSDELNVLGTSDSNSSRKKVQEAASAPSAAEESINGDYPSTNTATGAWKTSTDKDVSSIDSANNDKLAPTRILYRGGRRLSSALSSLSSSMSTFRRACLDGEMGNSLDITEAIEGLLKFPDDTDNIVAAPTTMDSMTMLESLADNPSPHIATLRVKELLTTEISAVDKALWDGIPQFRRIDLGVGRLLGKGTFSDVFEVTAVVAKETPERNSLESAIDDLSRNIKSKCPFMGNNIDDLDKDVHPFYHAKPEDDDLDREVEALFGDFPSPLVAPLAFSEDKSSDGRRNSCRSEKKREVRPMTYQPHPQGDNDNQPHSAAPQSILQGDSRQSQNAIREPSESQIRTLRRRPTDLGGSVCLGDLRRPQTYQKQQEHQVVLAMKCLRPHNRSCHERFMIGIEDLIHETTMLASLDHINIIKIHGRAGDIANRIGDGFFILLDRLTETLDDRFVRWKNLLQRKKGPPSLAQVNTACYIADALSYLHSKSIIFRDLKPSNIGFDSTGTVKLFDFGFALSVADGDNDKPRLLHDRCGTPRYMAPENALDLGYSLPADVYSFGILLWEICALKKPFGSIKSAHEFNKAIFKKGVRPKLSTHWPECLSAIMISCWSESARERPNMQYVKTNLSAIARNASMRQQVNGGGNSLYKRLSMSRRNSD